MWTGTRRCHVVKLLKSLICQTPRGDKKKHKPKPDKNTLLLK